MKNNKGKIISGIIIGILLIAVTFVTIKFWPFFSSLNDEEVRNQFIADIRGSWYGILIFLGLQVLQVVIAFIPGEVVEILAGVLYGPFFGMLFCLIGVTIAAIIIYFLVKKLGEPFVRQSVGEKQYKKFSFLNDPRRCELILFFILLMPLTPKDPILYIVPLTKIRFKNFLIINFIARIPSVITSTWAGDYLLQGNFLVVGIIYGVNFIVAVVCIIFNKQIVEWFEKIRNKTKNNSVK